MLTLHWAGPASRANRKASVDEGDDINNYSVILKKHINRMQVAEKVIAELTPTMTEFHTKVDGELSRSRRSLQTWLLSPRRASPCPPA